MAVMRVAQVSRPKGPFEIVERPIPQPGAGSVRIRVHACGICHSDSLTKEGAFPGLEYPRVPGHEVAGVIDAVGPGVAGWETGQKVGVGWNGGYCGYCDHCRRGEFFACVRGQVTGVTFDGGYGEYMVAPASAVALMPADLPPVEAAPLMCAGLTTFNCAAEQRGAAGRCRRRTRAGRSRPPRRPVRREDGLSHSRHRSWKGQGAARPPAGGVALYRQPGAGPRGGTPQAGWCQGHPGDGNQRRGDERRTGRLGRQRHATDRRGGRVAASIPHVAAHGMSLGQGLVFRNLDRLAGHACVQRADRRAADERDLSAGSVSPRLTTT